ncbi:MAG: argininosuccinate synthase [Candidatus Omnitrophica bacterium]|nr:argininosuccinate synthase [Candidatus Omnitrophota bacterium]
MAKEKIVLAYSGGLDTSVAISWLKENYDAEVIAYTADLGQIKNKKVIHDKSLATGAKRFYLEDLREKFLKDFAFKALAASALYEGKYPLISALSRPLIAQRMVEIAREEKATALAHGATGKGNDQVRFELTFKALAPNLKIIAPAREWEFKSREEEIAYSKKKKIPISVTKKNPYSIDRNLWGVSIECGILEEPWKEPPEDAYQMTVSPKRAPNKESYLSLEFEKGIPIKINGKKYQPVALMEKLNKIGGENGIGRIDIMENRLIGIKSREVYEAPGAMILYNAHDALERLVLDRETFHHKRLIAERYGQLIYNGLWFSPERESLEKFIAQTQKRVSGVIRLKLYKGNAIVAGRKSPYSLYQKDLATYSKEDIFDQKSAQGFIDLFGLPLKIMAPARKKKK